MSKRKLIVNIVTLCLLAGVCVLGFVMANRSRPKPVELPEGMEYLIEGKVAVAHFSYFGDVEFFAGDWDGDYDIQILHGPEAQNVWCKGAVMDYEEYQRFCSGSKPAGYVQTYDDPSLHYLVYGVWLQWTSDVQARLAAVNYSGPSAHMYVWAPYVLESGPGCSYVVVVPTDQAVTYCAIHQLSYTVDEYEKAKQDEIHYETMPEPEKPILYLYPEVETDVTVTLGCPELVTHAYPKYDGSWRVKARPDGTLTDLQTGRELYSLYYENVSAVPLPQTEEGFVVRGEDTAAFLEEKLAILGLTDREAEEFIIYWLPRLEENEWTYIRFADPEEIAAEMPLTIEPQPDSLIRVLMLWRPLDAPIEVAEQKLEMPRRTGFTAVEWGGAEIN